MPKTSPSGSTQSGQSASAANATSSSEGQPPRGGASGKGPGKGGAPRRGKPSGPRGNNRPGGNRPGGGGGGKGPDRQMNRGGDRRPRKPAETGEASPPGLAARRAAVDLLHNVLRRNLTLGDALLATRSWRNLPDRDRSLARMMLSTCLRHLGETDALLALCMEKPLPAEQHAVQDILRLGATQLLHMRIPPHAAVGLSVELAPRLGAYRFKGLINGVLRRLDREKDELRQRVVKDAGLEATPDLLALPAWLRDKLIQDYGAETAAAIARGQTREAPLDLSVKDPQQSAALAESLGATLLPGGSLRLAEHPADLQALPGYAEGQWWVQDMAATLPVLVLAPQPGQEVIDLCAAPGGKSALLAARGAHPVSVESIPARMERMKENFQRLGLADRTVLADARRWEPEAPVSAVLLDAPCSATGTLRRHPDAAWLKQADSLDAVIKVQDELLDHAAGMIAPGGCLVYATCSLLHVEGEERIRAFLARQGGGWDIEPPAADSLPGPEFLTPEGFVRSLPHFLEDQGGMDGFFVARLRRTGARPE